MFFCMYGDITQSWSKRVKIERWMIKIENGVSLKFGYGIWDEIPCWNLHSLVTTIMALFAIKYLITKILIEILQDMFAVIPAKIPQNSLGEEELISSQQSGSGVSRRQLFLCYLLQFLFCFRYLLFFDPVLQAVKIT